MFTKQQIIELMDLTSLNDNDTSQDISALCQQATTPLGKVASVCIYKQFIPVAKNFVNDINITTVINFPSGRESIKKTLNELNEALSLGANEIDVVMPYYLLQNQKHKEVELFLKEVKKQCNNNILKVIIESGELKSESLIRLASKISIFIGADFIKTSTGKVPINATLDATKYMLEEIKSSQSNCGFKAAGGIKTYVDACEYLDLAKSILGEKFITPKTFRFGASSLLNDLLNNNNKKNQGY